MWRFLANIRDGQEGEYRGFVEEFVKSYIESEADVATRRT